MDVLMKSTKAIPGNHYFKRDNKVSHGDSSYFLRDDFGETFPNKFPHTPLKTFEPDKLESVISRHLIPTTALHLI